jgi:Skp family chaperone for outer membrane proteins
MDRHALAVLIPVLGTLFTGLIVLSFTRMGRAIAARIEGRVSQDAEHRFAAQDREIAALRTELESAHERLDFTERLLASQRENARVIGEG